MLYICFETLIHSSECIQKFLRIGFPVFSDTLCIEQKLQSNTVMCLWVHKHNSPKLYAKQRTRTSGYWSPILCRMLSYGYSQTLSWKLWMGRITSSGLQVPLLQSGLFGMHTSTAAFSLRPFLEACAHWQVQQQLCSQKAGVTAAAMRDSWDYAALRHQLHAVPSVEGHHSPVPSTRFIGLNEPSYH